MNELDLSREIGRLAGAVEHLSEQVQQMNTRLDRLEQAYSKRLAAVEKDIYAAKLAAWAVGLVLGGIVTGLAWLWEKVR